MESDARAIAREGGRCSSAMMLQRTEFPLLLEHRRVSKHRSGFYFTEICFRKQASVHLFISTDRTSIVGNKHKQGGLSMETPIKIHDELNVSLPQRTANEMVHLIRKLRWMGMEDEAEVMQAQLAAAVFRRETTSLVTRQILIDDKGAA
jgi:hypothetical protein